MRAALLVGSVVFGLACAGLPVPSLPSPPPPPEPAAPEVPLPLPGDAPADFCGGPTTEPAETARRRAWTLVQEVRGPRCAALGVLVEPDPAGVVVRDAPDGNPLGLAPPSARVEVAAFLDDWFLVCRASTAAGPVEAIGWVHGSRMRAAVAPREKGLAPLLDRPRAGAKVVTRAPGGAVLQVLDCDGAWWSAVRDGEVGWLAPGDVCATPDTGCR